MAIGKNRATDLAIFEIRVAEIKEQGRRRLRSIRDLLICRDRPGVIAFFVKPICCVEFRSAVRSSTNVRLQKKAERNEQRAHHFELLACLRLRTSCKARSICGISASMSAIVAPA